MAPGHTAAATQLPSPPPQQQPQDLYLRVLLNGSHADGLAHFLQTATGLAATASTLRRLGLKVDGPDPSEVQLSSLSGLQVAYVPATQELRLTAPVALLSRPATIVRAGGGATQSAAAASPSADGLVLNYDLFAHGQGSSWSAAGWGELRTVGLLHGVLSHSFVARHAAGPAKQRPYLRLDSSWRADFPDDLLTLELGDTFTSGPAWTRQARIGGITLKRNFSLRPEVPIAPFPLLTGEAVLPSTVELFIDGVRQSAHEVPAGNFQIDGATRLSGRGKAEIQVRDMLGQVRSTTVDFYGTPSLLRAGLSEWSLHAGLPRRAYGIRSDAYDSRPLLSGAGRLGLDDRLTLEGMVQARAGTSAAGAGAAFLLGPTGGVVTGSVALGRSGGGAGSQRSVGYSWHSRDFGFAGNILRRSAGYVEAADPPGAPGFTRRDSVFISGRVLAAQLGLAYARQDEAGQRRALLSANASMQVGRGVTFSVAVLKGLDSDRGLGLHLQLAVMLDSARSMSFAARRQGRGIELAADATQPAGPQSGGWGWRVRAAAGNAGRGGEVHLTRDTPAGQWSAGMAAGERSAAAIHTSASGSLLFLGSGVHAMRSSPEGFAVVSTDGVEGVSVRLENRLVGRTGKGGRLLVADLLSNQHNRLSIDTLDLPTDLRPDLTEIDVVPRGRSGALVSFRIRRVRPVHVVVRDWRGDPLLAGTVGRLSSAAAQFQGEPEPVVVGHGGEIYIEDLARDSRLVFDIHGERCELLLLARDASTAAPPARDCRIEKTRSEP